MEKLTDNQLSNNKGGFTMNVWMALGIASLVVFLSGVFEGITNPDRCRS